MTPNVLGPGDWNSLTSLLLSLWLFAFCTITFAINVLIGHALIPSLVFTRQLPFFVRLLRPIFYVVAAIALGADVFIILRLGGQLGILQNIYPRTLI